MSALIPYARGSEMIGPQENILRARSGPAPQYKNYVIFGLLVMGLFIGGAIYWAYSSKLDGAVVAPASLVVEGNRKTVEHLDGGIVRSILVSDGEFVEAGDVLVELESTELDVDLNVLGSQSGELMIRRARLLAQIRGAQHFSEENAAESVKTNLSENYWRPAFWTQKQVFEAEMNARRTEAKILDQRIHGLRDQIAGISDQRAANARQLKITRAELANLETLLGKGLVAVSRVNARRIDIERLQGLDASLKTQETQASNQVSELMLTGLSQEKLRREAITSELAAVEAQLAVIEPRYMGTTERLSRISVTAPTSGRVVNMSVFTIGGVVRPGEAILDIVPAQEPLIVEARVNTADIEKLYIGQNTRVRLSAFDQGDVPEAAGRIVDISADSLEDKRTGEAYYVARVTLDAAQPAEVANLELLPGMPVDLFVNTGERTVISYLTKPLSDRIARTFIE